MLYYKKLKTPKGKDVGRPKKYDHEEVLKQTMLQFWRDGYAETSLSDLEEATGVNRYSLYKGFGDKEKLFELSLKYYYQHIIELLLTPLVNPSPNLKHLNDFFLQLNTLLKGKYGEYGCLIQNSQKEGINQNKLVKRHGNQLWSTQYSLMLACLDSPKIKLPYSKEIGTQLLLAQFHTQISLARSHAPHNVLDGQYKAVLALISSWGN